MQSLLSRYSPDGSTRASLVLPLLFLASSLIVYTGTPWKHALLTSTTAWLSICTYLTLRTGHKSLLGSTPAQKLAWCAGGLLALAAVCERAVEGRSIWWAKALIPLLIFAIKDGGLLSDVDSGHLDVPAASPEKESPPLHSTSKSPMVLLSASAIAAVYSTSGSNMTVALGLSYAFASALAFLLIASIKTVAQSQRQTGSSVIYSANGFLAQPADGQQPLESIKLVVARDVSFAAALATGLAAITMESFDVGNAGVRAVTGRETDGERELRDVVIGLIFGVGIVLTHMVASSALLVLLQRKGAFTTSLLPLSAALVAQLIATFSLSRLWFSLLSACSAYIFINDQEPFSTGGRMRLKLSRVFTLVVVVSFIGLAIVHLQNPLHTHAPAKSIAVGPATEPLSPLQFTDPRVHPIDELVRNAEQEWLHTLETQSQTLEAAVTEYRRRYGMPPPPNFHKWFEFAQQKGVQLTDEYDTIYHSLLPFWALSPATIRARTREAIGFDNKLIGLMLRDGKALHVEGGPEWQQEATIGMMEQFAQYLPDMDLAFNIHDEPRVVVPHDELSRLIDAAVNRSIPPAASNPHPKNTFSPRPQDLSMSKRVEEVKITRFNEYAHQPVWLPSRMSCSPESRARALDDTQTSDNQTAYALTDMGFIYNHTAFSDVCNSPSFGNSYGFFNRPNAFNIVHDLFPIFSQSKISSFQDIVYPSPWYWFGKVEYEEKKDLAWGEKANKLWWRGSTTGGFSRHGGWRRQHRQHIVGKINAKDTAQILTDVSQTSDTNTPEWRTKDVPRQDYKDLMDVHFSHVGQCDPGDCDAQREKFEIVEPSDQQEAWKFKYLLDMDGNAFSGRFYAFLQSRSLVFKMAVFREWHEEWIKPWVHYIPLSLRSEEVLEAVRYFSGEKEGMAQGERMAEAGREWAGKALRKEDFEAWFFRLLLEYGRLVDDNRDEIGFTGS
ncbi:hypothetical protein MBLNU230_g0343t1 [Neophaeotheca triangularis]